jgi:hypothetical protein
MFTIARRGIHENAIQKPVSMWICPAVEDSGSDKMELPFTATVESAGRKQLELVFMIVAKVRSFFGCASPLEIHRHGTPGSFLLLDVLAFQQITASFKDQPEIRLPIFVDLLEMFQSTETVEVLQILP